MLTLKQCCRRFISDLARSKRKDWPYRFDQKRADDFRDFCKTLLRVEDPVKGDGTEIPMVLTPFQEFITANIFGWVHKETGARRFKETYWEISKGSGKSPLAAAIALYLLVADGERDAMIQLCARTYEQAGVVARAVEAFLVTSPTLRAVVRTLRENDPSGFVHRGKSGVVGRIIRMASPKDKGHVAKGRSGPRPSGAVIDEVHELHSDAMYQALILGQKNRRQPLIVLCTNSGRRKESTVGRFHQRALSVLQGSLDDPTFFPVVIKADKDTDPMNDESLWPALHPDLDFLLPRSTLKQSVARAKGSPDQTAEIKRLYFGTWSPKAGNTLFESRTWERCERLPDKWPDSLEELPCFLGLDLARTNDLACLAAVWMDPEDEEAPQLWCRVWPFMPECDLNARFAREQVDYPTYHEQGHLVMTGDDRIEYEHLAWLVGQLMKGNRVMCMAYDRWDMPNFKAAMRRREVPFWTRNPKYPLYRGDGLELVEHGQGSQSVKGYMVMEDSIKALEKWVLNRNLRAWYNPLLRHHVVDGGEIEYGKQGQEKNRRFVSSDKRAVKNDCLVALTMACGAAQKFLNLPPEVRERMYVKPETRKMGYAV